MNTKSVSLFISVCQHDEYECSALSYDTLNTDIQHNTSILGYAVEDNEFFTILKLMLTFCGISYAFWLAWVMLLSYKHACQR